MKRLVILMLALFLVLGTLFAPVQMAEAAETNAADFPRKVYGGAWGSPAGHLQGIACDDELNYMYMSFTDRLVKIDMRENKIVGSVTGLLAGGIYGGGAHLGCLAYHDGHVYGSLEYKAAEKFYIAVFDCDAITDMDMDYKTSGVMTTLYMDEVVRDYIDDLDAGEHENAIDSMGHRFGCSGIDGVTFGHIPGSTDAKEYMFVAYGIYRNNNRQDNDCQVLLCFDPETFSPMPFDQNMPHTEGPVLYKKLFVYTGNTQYGVQNLEYDRDTGDLWMIVYPGQKEQYPNSPIYLVDGSMPVREETLPVYGMAYEEGLRGDMLTLKAGAGILHNESGVWSIPVMPRVADTGFISIGNDLFYVAQSGKMNGKQYGYAILMHLDRESWKFSDIKQ